MPPEVRVRCRILVFCGILWELFSVYCPSDIRCDMFEVLTESDLSTFVCPCGSQFNEEINIYQHFRILHNELVFKPWNGLQHTLMGSSSSGIKLDAYGDIASRKSNLVGSESQQVNRLRKLFTMKGKIPKVPSYLMNKLEDKKRLPKWFNRPGKQNHNDNKQAHQTATASETGSGSGPVSGTQSEEASNEELSDEEASNEELHDEELADEEQAA